MECVMQNMNFQWRCHGCDGAGDLSADFICPNCQEPRCLEPIEMPDGGMMDEAPDSLWHYAPLLPVSDPACRVSIGEGNTPLASSNRLGAELGFSDLRFKNEMTNPTGSFKDRQISVGISHAREIGADTVAVVSSGNVAAATAAYAARAGMRAILFMHGQAGAGKIAQASTYGPDVICVESPSPSVVFDLCIEACKRFGWYHLSTAGLYEPYNVEGAKTIAYELYHQYKGDLPEWIIAPVGGGGLLGGLWRGLLDLKRLGKLDKLPRLAGVQATGCAVLEWAIKDNIPFLETLKHPWPDPKTVAGGIADDILFDGHTVLPAVRSTDGMAISVNDDQIKAGLHELAEKEGLLCELTTAVVPAALHALAEAAPGARACAVLTGNGIKELSYLREAAPKPASIPSELGALEALLKE
jgi:threonine synthase